MKSIKVEARIQKDGDEFYNMLKFLRRYEDKIINGSIKLKKKNVNEEINRFKDINDKYIFSNVKKKIKLKINGCIKIKKGTPERYYKQLVKKILHGNISINNKNINNILNYIEYIKYIKLCGNIRMIKKNRTDENENENEKVSPLLLKGHINKLRYLKKENDVKKERNQMSLRKSSYNIEKKEILDLTMKRYSHFGSERYNNYNLKNNSFYDNINVDHNKIRKTKVNKEKEKNINININIHRTNGSINNKLNNKEFSFALYPSSGDKIRDVDEVQKKMNTFKLNIPSSIISKFNKTNKTNMLEERKSINYNLIKMRQEFMYEPRNNDKEKHNKIHLKGTINYIKSDNNNNKKKNNSNSNSNSNYYNNFHSIKFMFRGKKKKKIIKDKITDANYILCNEEKKKLLDLDRYNNETNKSHETYVLSGNKIYDKIDNKNIFLDHSVFLNYNKKGQKRLSSSSSIKNKNINKSTYDETMLSMSDVDDIDYFMHIKEKNAIKYKDYMNKPKNKGQGNISIEEKKSVLKIKMTEGQENIKEKKNYINDTKCKINKKESNKYNNNNNNNNNMSNIKNKKFSSVSRKLSKHFSSSRSGAIFNMSNNKKENKNNKKKRRIKLNNGNRYMKKYVNKIMNMSILRRNSNNVNSSVFITHKKCFDKPKKDTKMNDKKCSNGVVETVDKKESINKLNVENNETQMMKKGNKNEDMDDNKNEDIEDNKNKDMDDNKNEDMNDNKNKDMDDNKNEDMEDNKNDNIINLSTDKNIKIGFYFEEACDIKQSNDKNISTTNETKKIESPLMDNILTKKMGSPLMNNMLTKKMGSPLMNNILTKKQGMLKQFAITKENMDITKKEGVVLTMKKSVSIKKDADINISKDENVIEKNKVNFTIKSVQNILSKQLFKSKANPLIINKSNDSQIVATNKITVGVNVPVKSSLFKKDENEEKNNSNNIEEEEKKNVNMEKLILNEQEENYLNDKSINKAGLSKEDDVDIKEPVLTNTKEDIIKGEDQSISTNIVKEQHMKEEKINDNTKNDNTKNDNTKNVNTLNDDTMNDKDKSDIINKKNSLESVKEEITEKEMLDEKDKMVPQLLECNSLQNKDENIKDMNIENCDDHMKDNITNKNNNMFIKKINIKMVPMLNKKAIPKSKTLPVLLKNKINILKEKFTTNKKLSNDSIDKTESCNIKMDEHEEEEKQNIESEKKIIKPSKSIHKMINPGRHSFFNANKLLNSIEVKIGEHNSKMNEKEEPIKMLSNSVSIISDGKMDSLDKCGEEEKKKNDVKTDIDVNTHIDADVDVNVDVNINVEENINQSEKAKMVLKKGIPKLMMKFKAFPTKKMGIQNLENNKKVNSLRSIKDDNTLEEKNDTSEKGDDNIEKKDDTIEKTDDTIEKKDDTIEKTDDTIEKKDDTIEKTDDTIEKTNEILNKQCKEEVKNEIDNTLQDKDDTQHILKTTKIILMKKIPPKYNKMNTVKMGDIKFPNNMNKFINKFHMVKNLSTLKEFPVKKLIKKDSNEENNSLEKIKVDEEKINDANMEKEADEDVIKVEEDLMDKKVNGETEIEMDKNVKDNMEKDDIQQDNMEKDNMEKDNMEKDNMEKDNMEKDNMEKDNIEKDNIEKDNMEKDNMEKDNIEKDNMEKYNIEKDNMEKNNMEKDNIQQDNIQQDNSETSLNKNEEPNVVAESATIENEQVDKIIPRSFSKSLSIPMKIPTIKENMNKAKPTFWNKPKGKMFFLTKKEKSISQAKEILRSLEKSNN